MGLESLSMPQNKNEAGEQIEGTRETVSVDEQKENEHITLRDILNKKDSLDFLKDENYRLKLIDGPFLKQNPDWKDQQIKYLHFNGELVTISTLMRDERGFPQGEVGGNAYLEELVIDVEETNNRAGEDDFYRN